MNKNRISKIIILLVFLSIIFIDDRSYSQDRLSYPNISESQLSPEEAEKKLRVTGTHAIYHGKATVDTARNIITLTEQPYIITSTHFVRADEIKWFREEGRVQLTSNARIRSFETNDVLAGKVATYYQYPTNEIARIEGKADDKQRAFAYSLPNVIEADELKVIDENTYEAHGDVKFYNVIDDDRASGEDSTYDKKKNLLKLEGNAYIQYGDVKSFADKITAHLDDNHSIMEDNAKIMIKSNIAKAERIELFDSENQREAILKTNAVLEQYAKNDPERRKKPVRRIKAKEINYKEDLNSDKREVYMEDESTIIDYSNPESAMKGEPYRIIEADDIDYIENKDGTNIHLKGNSSYEQIDYKVVEKKGSQTRIKTYSELVTKANLIDVTYDSNMENEVIDLNGNTKILSPTRTIFADKGKIVERKNATMEGNVEVYEHNENVTEITTRAYGSMLEAYDVDRPEMSRYILIGDANVYQGDNHASGNKMIMRNNDNVITIEGNAKFKGEDIQASAGFIRSKEHEDGKRTFLLSKNAKIKQGEDYASGNEITMDERDGSAEIKGNAVYIGENTKASADRIKSTEYEEDGKRKYILMGEAEVEQGDDYASGERIMLDEKTNVAIIDGNGYFKTDEREVNANYIKSEEIYQLNDGTYSTTNKEGRKTTKLTLENYVRMNDPTQSIRSDFATVYQTEPETNGGKTTSSAYLTGQVEIIDKEQDITIKGNTVDYVELSETETLANISGNAFVSQEDGQMDADIITYKEKTIGNNTYTDVIGIGGVEVINNEDVITSKMGELHRVTPNNDGKNYDNILFKGDVVVDGEEIDAVCQDLTLNRTPIKGTNLIKEEWLLYGDVEIDQQDRHASAGVVEYVKDYPTKNANEPDETYNFYQNAVIYEILEDEGSDTATTVDANKEASPTAESDTETEKEKSTDTTSLRKTTGSEKSVSETDESDDDDNSDDEDEADNENSTMKYYTGDGEWGELLTTAQKLEDNRKDNDDGDDSENGKDEKDGDTKDEEKPAEDSEKDDETSGKKDIWSELEFTINGILREDEIPYVEKFSDNVREYPNQRRVMGDRVFYNVNTRDNVKTTSLESVDNAKFYDPRFDVIGDTIELVIKSYPKTNKDDDYELFINEGLVDKSRFADETDEEADSDNDTDTASQSKEKSIDKREDSDSLILKDDKDDESGSKNDKSDKTSFGNESLLNTMSRKHYLNLLQEFSRQRTIGEPSDNEKDDDDDLKRTVEKTDENSDKNKDDEKQTSEEKEKRPQPKAIIRDYEEKVLVEGNEIYGKYVKEKNGTEYISFDAWENVVLFSEEDEFKTTGQYLDFHRETFRKNGKEQYKDYIKTIGEVMFNSKNEVTGKAEMAVVNRDTSLPREDIDLYENAQIRRYEYSTTTVLEDILTLSGGHIYMNGIDNYLVSTEEALLVSEKEDLTINADRIEYYEQVDRAFARGNVLTTLNDNRFTSNYLYYDGMKKQIMLKGKVRYILGTSVDGTADEILFDMETEEIISEGGSADLES